MKGRMVLAQIVVFAVISIVIINYTLFSLLGVKVHNYPFTVTVQLSRGGGVFDNSTVTYRGVTVGRVKSIALHPDSVTVALSINHGTKIPDNATANVYDLSPVGEQYVDLVPPARPATTYLRGGSVIPAARTTTPIDTATLLYDLEQFLDSISPKDVQILGREGATAFAGTGPALKSLLTGSTTLVDELTASQDATVNLLRNGSTLLNTAARHAADFDAFTAALKALSSTLATTTPAFQALVGQGAADSQLVQSLVDANAPALSVLLADAASLSQIQVARIPALKALLVAVPDFAAKFPTVVHNGTITTVVNINATQTLCRTGVPFTSPLSGKASPVYAVNCPTNSGLMRGAATAPRPGGSATGSSVGATALTSYDPATGLAQTGSTVAGSGMVDLGVSGGQSSVLGHDSWQALLLAGTGG